MHGTASPSRQGKINLGNILRGANKEMKYLPTVEGYMDSKGRGTLCLIWCLGICIYAKKGRCCFRKGHVANEQITPTFASNLCQVLAPGVQYVLTYRSTGQGLSQKKHKGLG